MTISITSSACTYTGDGSTVTFEVKNGSDGIYFDTASELTVTLRSGNTITAQTVGTHYTVSGAGSAAGSVTFVTAPSSGVEVRIERNTPITQTLTLSNAGAFSPTNVMGAFDKLTRIAQDLSRGSAGEGSEGTYDTDQMTKTAGGTAWDAETLPIGNVGDATSDDEAVSFGQMKSWAIEQGEATGDVVGPASAVDGELVLFSGTSGKSIKRATTTGLLKATSGVPSAAVAGTDYVTPTGLTSGATTAVQKGDGAGALEDAAATDLGAGRHTIWIPASSLMTRSSNGPAVTRINGSNIEYPTLAYDASTNETAYGVIGMPKSWDAANIRVQYLWTASSGSGTVRWSFQARAASDDDVIEAAYSGGGSVDDTLLATGDAHITNQSNELTIDNSAAKAEPIFFRIYRSASDGADTFSADAHLIGAWIYITTDAITDD